MTNLPGYSAGYLMLRVLLISKSIILPCSYKVLFPTKVDTYNIMNEIQRNSMLFFFYGWFCSVIKAPWQIYMVVRQTCWWCRHNKHMSQWYIDMRKQVTLNRIYSNDSGACNIGEKLMSGYVQLTTIFFRATYWLLNNNGTLPSSYTSAIDFNVSLRLSATFAFTWMILTQSRGVLSISIMPFVRYYQNNSMSCEFIFIAYVYF